MLASIIKPASIALVFVTATGILLHDMNIDKATKVALMPALVTSAGAVNMMAAKIDHTHTERAAAPKQAMIFNSSLPKIHPPKDDDRRYVQNKKSLALTGGEGQSALWPSV